MCTFALLFVMSLSSAAVLFSDNFESYSLGNLSSSALWSVAGSPTVVNTDSFTGNKSVQLNRGTGQTPDDMMLSVLINASNNSNVYLSYARKTVLVGSPSKPFYSQYSLDGGSSWISLENVSGSSNWSNQTYSLGPSANNNPNLRIAFGSNVTSANDYALLDDVYVYAAPAPQCTPNLTNTSWSAFSNVTSCQVNNTQVQNGSITQSDGCGNNITFYQTQEVACTYVPPVQNCVQNWSVGQWSACVNGTQTRTVTDLANCSNSTGMPATQQACSNVALPTCSVDYLEVIGAPVIYNITANPYVNFAGSFFAYISAYSNNESCSISSVGYNRTSPNFQVYSWDDANYQFMSGLWRSDQQDASFVNGNHTICCIPESRQCSGAGCAVYVGNPSCRDFCIDTQAPTVVAEPYPNGQDCSDESGVLYSNSLDISWSWSPADSNGCAPISYYNVQLFFSNGTLVGNFTVNGTTFNYTGVNGQDYYIKVNAVDAAGNVGGQSVASDEIVVDTVAPMVDIFAPTGAWFGQNFVVQEWDNDTNLLNCSYQIDGGSWTSISGCTSGVSNNFTFDVYSVCGDGNVCPLVSVNKLATDKACNVGTDTEYYNIDLQKPNTTKTVGDPKINASDYSDLAAWVSILYNGFFVTNETGFILGATDFDGSGVNATYYNITLPNGTVVGPTFYVGPFNLPNVDGLYNITYWSVDNVGNVEVLKYEIDKLDNIAPNTTKTWGMPNYWNGTALWVTSNTVFNFSCNDTESGCNGTYFTINENEYSGNSFQINGEEALECAPNYVEYQSVDRLGNWESTKNETDWLDNNGPSIDIVNPNLLELNRTQCYLNVVASVKDLCSGLNQSTVRAEVRYANGTVAISSFNLALTYPLSGGYSATVDTTSLLPGQYSLIVYAKDNLGNENSAVRNFTISPGIFVQYVNPYSCSVQIGQSGNCSFTFNACTRGSDQINMYIEKLGAGHDVDPGSVNAMLVNGLGNAQVGIWETDGSFHFATNLTVVNNTCQNANGWIKFNLTMQLDANDTTVLGGNYQVNYTLNSFDNLNCLD